MKYCNMQRFDSLTRLPESITVCATIDDNGKEQEITELMIRRACEEMDADQLWPYASRTLIAGMRAVSPRGADILPFKRPAN